MGLIRDSRRSWFVHVLTGAVAGVSAGDSF
jgi:hypothetical protein